MTEIAGWRHAFMIFLLTMLSLLGIHRAWQYLTGREPAAWAIGILFLVFTAIWIVVVALWATRESRMLMLQDSD